MRVVLGIVLDLVAGRVATGAAVLAIGGLANISQAEGAFAMSAIFVAGPASGIAGAVASGVLVLGARRWA